MKGTLRVRVPFRFPWPAHLNPVRGAADILRVAIRVNRAAQISNARTPDELNPPGNLPMISLMKRNVLFTALAAFVFGVCFALLWPVVHFLVEDTPSLTFAAGGLCVVLSGAITLRIIRDLMSVPQKD